MHTRSKGVRGLQPLDLEIERGVKQRRRERRAILQQQKVAMESTSQGVTRDSPEQEGEHHVLNPQNDPRRAPVQNDYQQVSIKEHDHIPPQVHSPRHQGMPQQGYQPPCGEPPLGNPPQRNLPHAPPPYHHPYPPRLPYHYEYYYPPGPPPQPQVPHDQMPPPRDSVVHMVQKLAQNQTQPPAVTTLPVPTHVLVSISTPPLVPPYSSGPYQRNFQHQGNAHLGFSWGNPSRVFNPTGVARGPTSWVSWSTSNDGIRDMGDDTLSKSMKHKKKKLKVMGFGKIASSIGGMPPNEDKNVLLQPSKATLAV
nr:hypothetical protein Iba_chr12aCG9480 [Ipomoea batatas]